MADTGFVLPQTAASVARSGSGGQWTGPNEAKASDDSYAWISLAKSYYSDYLRLMNFDFSSIPDDAILDGIVVKIERKAGIASNICDSVVRIHNGTNKASATKWGTSESSPTYGGSTDKWGTSYDIEDIQDSGFGVDISVQNDSDAITTAYIDCVWIKVYYTEAVTFIPQVIII